MGSIMFLILINLICIGNNEGIHNEVQWASSPALTPAELGSPLLTHAKQCRSVCAPCGELAVSDSDLVQDGVRWKRTLGNRLAHAVNTLFLLPPPPEELLGRGGTGAEGGGNLFEGKQFQASAVCACTFLPTNLVLSVIRPGKRMRSAARELDGLGAQSWVYPGLPREMKPAGPPPSLCCKVTTSDQNLG